MKTTKEKLPNRRELLTKHDLPANMGQRNMDSIIAISDVTEWKENFEAIPRYLVIRYRNLGWIIPSPSMHATCGGIIWQATGIGAATALRVRSFRQEYTEVKRIKLERKNAKRPIQNA